MKRILFSLLLTLATLDGSAQNVDAVWGIPFGTAREEVMRLVNQKHNTTPRQVQEERVVYEDCKFGAYNAHMIFLRFYEGRLYGGTFFIKTESEPRALNEYRHLVDDLALKYGGSHYPIEVYKSPFHAGDGNELLALKSGYATISDSWYFPKGVDRDKAVSNMAVYLSEGVELIVNYEQTAIALKVDEREKQKQLSDY